MDVYKLKSKFWKLSWCGSISLVGVLSSATVAQAQNRIIPDGTLGAEQSIVGPTDDITGGATRSQNLFHSFSEFSIGRGNSAYFNTGNSPIANIFARVTGANQSAILGILGTRGVSNTNLFLINPNGIVFGPEGSLEVQGSFIGTTANAIQFSDQSIFSASDPNSSSLVTVKPSALLFNRINSGAIENQSVADAKNQFNSVAKNGLTGLRVPDGQNLLLVGGDVFLNGGDLHALGGQIELGGIKSTGIVGINLDSGEFQLDFPANADLADVTLGNPSKTIFNQSKVNVTAAGDGRISIAAKNLILYDASEITAGIGAGQGTPEQLSIGKAIQIKVDSLLVKEGSVINTDILGRGNSGDIDIQAEDILLDGQEFRPDIPNINPNVDRSSKITSRIEPIGQDKSSKRGGDILINTGTLTIDNGALISTSTDAKGNPGKISITARENVLLRGVGTDVPSTISSQVIDGAEGKGGPINLTVTEGSLSIKGGASINTSTESQGDTGNINIVVRDGIELEGAGFLLKSDKTGDPLPEPEFKSSGIFSTIESDEEKTGVGKQGAINIYTGTLDVKNGARISTIIEGNGTDIGNIDINTKGKITLNGQSSIKNSDNKFVPSGIFSNLIEGGSSKGGSIKITSKEQSLFVENGARINASTDGNGNAQDIFIDVKGDAIFTGKGDNLEADNTSDFSGVYSLTLQNSSGNGGDIRIDARSVILRDGSRIQNSTLSKNEGNAGNINIFPKKSLLLEGSNEASNSRIESNVQEIPGGNGDGGTINIGRKDQKADSVTIKDGGFISVSTFSDGDAGDINIFAQNSVLLEGESIGNSESRSSIGSRVNRFGNGDGGEINIDTGSLELKSGAFISANTFNNGNGGNINIDAKESVLIEGANSTRKFPSTIESQLAGQSDIKRQGGKIDVKANFLTVSDTGFISTSSLSEGDAGKLTLNIRGTISLNNGNILSSVDSDAATLGDGTGGDLTVNAKDLKLSNFSEIRASNTGQGDAGNINLNIADQIDSIDSKISTDTQTGAGGRVDIAARNILLKGDSDIQTSVASGVFKGGDITIDSGFLIAFDDSDILAFAVDGTGGNIDFSRTIFFGESYQPSLTDSNSNIASDVFTNNSRVDINASGGIAPGTVIVPDSSFVQNSVTDLPENVIPPDQLTAGSCIARRTATNKSSFVVTGNDGLPTRPNGSIVSAFPTGTVRSATSPKANKTTFDDALTEPTGVFEVEDGRMILSSSLSLTVCLVNLPTLKFA